MAFDLLFIPAIWAEYEGIFSLAQLAITSQRNRMTDAIIEAIECMKNWLYINAISL
jgi:hypothetical protein